MEKPTIHNLLTQIFTRAWQWMKPVQETPNPIQIANDPVKHELTKHIGFDHVYPKSIEQFRA